tara:strand:- start:637 stop:1041 length:405 start_codon:yes stop_codon:yes gene_type:complete
MKIFSKINKDLKIGEIIKINDLKDGTTFYTADNDFLQVASIFKNDKFEIKPHVHKENIRYTNRTQEAWILIKGNIKIDFFDIDNSYLSSDFLNPGDISILYNGGHAFKKKSEEMILYEIKNGPYDPAFLDKLDL